MLRKTWMEVDLGAVITNYQTVKKISGKEVIPVIKADAYGCGDVQVVQALAEQGISMIAVSSIEEGIHLRRYFPGSILVLGPTEPEHIPLCIEHRITINAYSNAWLEKLPEDCTGLVVHLKYDTGMNRIGFKTIEELQHALDVLNSRHCTVEGIFTHFVNAEEDIELTYKQYYKFEDAVRALRYPFKYIHCDNSAASLTFQAPVSNACRLGISMYGIPASSKVLYPAVRLYSTVAMIKHIEAGESISYGATYTSSYDEWIATIPIGYADGLIRKNQGRLVYAGGIYGEIVGRVCMDQCMVRFPKYVPEGTVVEFFGPHISIEAMADDLGTIPYEIMCGISDRVTRVYTLNNTIKAEVNSRFDH